MYNIVPFFQRIKSVDKTHGFRRFCLQRHLQLRGHFIKLNAKHGCHILAVRCVCGVSNISGAEAADWMVVEWSVSGNVDIFSFMFTPSFVELKHSFCLL